ncbi:MAG: hypothetical protein ACYC2U_03310 [Candidatus Amoebophilus sp.]
MERLLVEKSLERRGQIGPLYVHEAVFLLLGGFIIFFVLSIIRYWVFLSLWWYTATPCLFIISLLLSKVFRKESNPTWLFSYLSFYLQQPRYLYIQKPIYAKKSKII